MADKHVLVDAEMPQVRKSRKGPPKPFKPWVMYGERHTPKFEQGADGYSIVHVGYELEHAENNPAELILSDKKLYLKVNTTDTLLYFWTEHKGRLTTAHNIPGYAVFPLGFFNGSKDVKHSNQQTMYKRTWQMTFEEWKQDKPLTCETSDEKMFWSEVHAYMDRYKEDGRERKPKKVKRESDQSVQSTQSTPSMRSASVPSMRSISGSSMRSVSADTRTDKILDKTTVTTRPVEAVTTYHYAVNARRRPSTSAAMAGETTHIMDDDRTNVLTLYLRQMAKDVPADAKLECVVGIWRVPDQKDGNVDTQR